jgi:hypothetical protein
MARMLFVLCPLLLLACEARTPVAPDSAADQVAPAFARSGSATAASTDFAVVVQTQGELTRDGTALVPVTITCPADAVVIEALLTLGQQQASALGPIVGATCDGTARVFTARVTSTGKAFHPGSVNASAYVLICDSAGTCPSVSSLPIKVLLKPGKNP